MKPWQFLIERGRRYVNRLIAAEISSFSRYYDRVIQWKPRPEDHFVLFEAIQCAIKQRVLDGEQLPDLSREVRRRTIILINGNFNYDRDIQKTLSNLKTRLSRSSRVVFVGYNPYFRFLYRLAGFLAIRRGEQPKTVITMTDSRNLAKLSGFELVRIRPAVYFPTPFFGLGSLVNSILPSIPLFRWLGLAAIGTLRPIIPESKRPSFSVIIPARNERDNLERALSDLLSLEAKPLEVIFVEGHSQDGTWEEIQRLIPLYEKSFRILALRQKGAGKADAVRLGLARASGDLLTILDADLTVPPKSLDRFYEAYTAGIGDFINGNRRVYPMEPAAMRSLNRLGNLLFAKTLGHLLDVKIGDTLCGTKLMAGHDYRRFQAWREDFGDVDPFGDFELLFPSAILALGIVDVPIEYRARLYGDTKINALHHGFMLLKMSLVGLFRVKFGRLP